MLHRFEETRHLPYRPRDLFDLVADIEQYPSFLPWCLAARITARRPGQVEADLVVGKGPFRERFTSRVTLSPPEPGRVGHIDVEYLRGPLAEMENHWIFQPEGEGTRLKFSVAFAFRSAILNRMMSSLFHEAARRMIRAFEARARAQIGMSATASLPAED